MKLGDRVQFKDTRIEGEILERRIATGDELQYRVQFSYKGETHERWADESDLESGEE